MLAENLENLEENTKGTYMDTSPMSSRLTSLITLSLSDLAS